jgi:hypothetical protein
MTSLPSPQADGDHAGRNAGMSSIGLAIIGRRMEKLLPPAGALSTQILPPWVITKRRAMASPNPLPG